MISDPQDQPTTSFLFFFFFAESQTTHFTASKIVSSHVKLISHPKKNKRKKNYYSLLSTNVSPISNILMSQHGVPFEKSNVRIFSFYKQIGENIFKR
jgi:hypothetical protein